MKKLGTPIGAGPGNESENVGLEDFGTPLPLGRLAAGFLCFFAFLAFGVVAVWLWLEDVWRLWLFGFGVVAEGVVEVEVELDEEEEPECELVPDELELDELELLLVGDELDFDVVEVVVEEGGGADAQVSESTTAPSGSCTDEIGAPAAIGNVTVCPVASLTVSVHALASALGSARSPASSVPASVIPKLSFRLNDNSAQLLLPAPCASSQP